MRLIGHLKNEASAKTFAGYLASVDIRSMVEPDADGWAIWIHSEDQIEAGQHALAAYEQNPSDKKYQIASQAAEAIERQRRRDEAKAAQRTYDRDRILARSNMAPLTLALIALSVIVTLVVWAIPVAFNWLAIDDMMGVNNLPEVRAGQVWRLITPIFVHLTAMHIIFNMLWLYDLGTMVEKRQGMRTLGLMVVVIGIASNLGQYLLFGPAFGGMSGVLYGLFGYIWLRGECDPSSGLGLSSTTVWMMLIWFFLCLFNIITPVANGTHVVGLILGILWGAAPMAKRFFRG